MPGTIASGLVMPVPSQMSHPNSTSCPIVSVKLAKNAKGANVFLMVGRSFSLASEGCGGAAIESGSMNLRPTEVPQTDRSILP